jgi:hypothetical protein
VGELGFAEVVPHVSAWRFVEAIHPAAELHMQLFEHGLQVGGVVRGFGDEVVVVRKDRPRFQIPAVFFGDGQ